MAARRYQHGWTTASLRVMLASSLLMKSSRPQMPGKEKLSDPEVDDTGFQVCPVDGGEIVSAEDGSHSCQICSTPVEDMTTDVPDVTGN